MPAARVVHCSVDHLPRKVENEEVAHLNVLREPLEEGVLCCSIDEIGAWSHMSAEDRAGVMDDLPNRGAALKKRRGGRAARLKR